MDNIAIHSGDIAEIVTNLLWNYALPSGLPLRVTVLPFLINSLELNLIKLVFHLLTMMLKHNSNRAANPSLEIADLHIAKVFQNMTTWLIHSCCAHCGHKISKLYIYYYDYFLIYAILSLLFLIKLL